tara:strand:+ start:453 stop:668 length:216 start_codon:yes stop_codon:yes gene_type:complete
MTDTKLYHFNIKEVNYLHQSIEAGSESEAKEVIKQHLKRAEAIRDEKDDGYFDVVHAKPFRIISVEEGTII